MKKIIFALFGITALLFSSCTDFLEEDNKSGAPASSYFEDKNAYEGLVNAGYGTLRTVFGDNIEIFVAGTDLFKVGRAGLTSQGLGNYANLSPSDNSVKDFYANIYKGIRSCNDAIHYGNQYQHDTIRIAEMRFLRAFYYFHLVQQFGDVALVTEHSEKIQTSFPRTPAKDVYEFIITEMLAARKSVAKPAVSTTAYDGRINKRTVSHYLALVYLTRGYETYAAATDFSSAITWADSTLLAAPAPVALSSLTFDGSTSSIFYPGNEKKEAIFSVQYSSSSLANSTSGNSLGGFYGCYLGGADAGIGSGIPYMNTKLKPTMRLHNLLAEDAGDKRYAATFMQELWGDPTTGKLNFLGALKPLPSDPALQFNSVLYYYPKPGTTQAQVDAWVAANTAKRSSAQIVWSNTWDNAVGDKSFPCIKKFVDPAAPFDTKGTTSRRDITLARLAETYLIRAEAKIKLNGEGNASAISDINVVRTRAGASTVTTQGTINYILDERAREFAGELNRWYDLKRTGKLVELVPVNNPDVPSSSYMLGNGGIPKTLRPIPADAMGLNSSSSQNPGY